MLHKFLNGLLYNLKRANSGGGVDCEVEKCDNILNNSQFENFFKELNTDVEIHKKGEKVVGL